MLFFIATDLFDINTLRQKTTKQIPKILVRTFLESLLNLFKSLDTTGVLKGRKLANQETTPKKC